MIVATVGKKMNAKRYIIIQQIIIIEYFNFDMILPRSLKLNKILYTFFLIARFNLFNLNQI